MRDKEKLLHWRERLPSSEPPDPVSYMCNDGLKHLVVGQELHEGHPETFCKWTACGKYDVPADQSPLEGKFLPAWVTCEECKSSLEYAEFME